MQVKLTGNNCRCNACGLLFKSAASFDKHRTGDYTSRRCLTETELRAKGFEPNAKGFWRRLAPVELFSHRKAA